MQSLRTLSDRDIAYPPKVMHILASYSKVGNKSVRFQSRSRSTASFDEFSRDEKSDAASRSNVRSQVG
jgi:hypothetical protein